MKKQKTLGIIGMGSFARFICPFLKPFFEIKAYSRKPREKELSALGVKSVCLEEAASCDIIIPSVPVQNFEGVLEQIKPHLKAGAMVADVCSVKVKPLEIMRRVLPENVEIIGTHPLFGPQSGKNGIEGLRIVFCPLRCRDEDCVERFLSDSLKLKVFRTSPTEHDRHMSYVQALNHFIARALARMKIPESPLETPAYRRLHEMHEILRGDSYELFLTIQRENPFADGVRREFMSVLGDLENEIATSPE